MSCYDYALSYDKDGYTDDDVMIRKCERCGEIKECEQTPLMGYCEWWCERCYQAAVHSGEIKG